MTRLARYLLALPIPDPELAAEVAVIAAVLWWIGERLTRRMKT